MKRILVVHYSQSGQLRDIVQSVTAPLRANPELEVRDVELKPVRPYPFPWPFWRFFNTFPETVYGDADPIEPLPLADDERFDLVILAYQVWFLSPSLPTTAFLQSEQARRLLRDTPVITLIGCRNMWLGAQEKMKAQLSALGARLIDNIVLTDPAHSAATFISTPMWVLTGKRGPFLGGLVPAAGVAPEDVAAAKRFGDAISAQLPTRAADDASPMLSGLGAVRINERMIASETIAGRSFRLWGGLLRSLGTPRSPLRRLVLVVYVIFLITMILTVIPVSAVLKRLFAPLMRQRVARQRAYFAAPSGESNHLLEPNA